MPRSDEQQQQQTTTSSSTSTTPTTTNNNNTTNTTNTNNTSSSSSVLVEHAEILGHGVLDAQLVRARGDPGRAGVLGETEHRDGVGFGAVRVAVLEESTAGIT